MDTQPDHFETRFIQGLNFGLAIYSEALGSSLIDSYKKSNLGLGLSLGHKLAPSWYGAISLRTGRWDYNRFSKGDKNGSGETTFPIFIASRIDYAPTLFSYDSLALKPIVSGGVGALWFRENLYKLLGVSKKDGHENPEPTFQLAAGARFQITQWLHIRVTFEWWTGVRTSRYNGYLWYAEILSGTM